MQKRLEAAAFQAFWIFQASEVGECGVNVHELHDTRAGGAVSLHAGGADDERRAGGLLEERALLPDAVVLAEVIAVVAPKDDDGVVGQLEFIQCGHQSADLRVDKRDGRVVGLQRLAQCEFIQIIMRHGAVMCKGGRGYVVSIALGRVRQAHVLERIHREIFFGRHIRRVRAEETNAEEKRLVAFLRHELDRLGGDYAIGLFLVRAVGGEPTERGADFSVRLGIEDERLVGLVAPLGIHRLLPTGRIIKTIGTDAGRDVVMIDLSHTPGPPAVAHKRLRERHRLGHFVAEMPVEIVHLDGVRPQPGHHAGARGIAERQLIVRAVKPHAGRRQPINVRRLGNEIAIATQRGCEVIDGDKQHIGLG